MNLTIFDGRKRWVETKVEPTLGIGCEDASQPPKEEREEYELNRYCISTGYNILSIENIQKLAASCTNCYRDQVVVRSIRGEFTYIEMYVARFGIALVQRNLNNVFADFQHQMVNEIMKKRVHLEDYSEIDNIFMEIFEKKNAR